MIQDVPDRTGWGAGEGPRLLSVVTDATINSPKRDAIELGTHDGTERRTGEASGRLGPARGEGLQASPTEEGRHQDAPPGCGRQDPGLHSGPGTRPTSGRPRARVGRRTSRPSPRGRGRGRARGVRRTRAPDDAGVSAAPALTVPDGGKRGRRVQEQAAPSASPPLEPTSTRREGDVVPAGERSDQPREIRGSSRT